MRRVPLVAAATPPLETATPPSGGAGRTRTSPTMTGPRPLDAPGQPPETATPPGAVGLDGRRWATQPCRGEVRQGSRWAGGPSPPPTRGMPQVASAVGIERCRWVRPHAREHDQLLLGHDAWDPHTPGLRGRTSPPGSAAGCAAALRHRPSCLGQRLPPDFGHVQRHGRRRARSHMCRPGARTGWRGAKRSRLPDKTNTTRGRHTQLGHIHTTSPQRHHQCFTSGSCSR